MTTMEQIEVNGNNNKIVSSLLLFLTGLGAGAAVALLLAPRSGAVTRRFIGDKVYRGKGWMKDKTAAAQAYVKDRGDELRGRAEEVAEVIGRPLCSDTALNPRHTIAGGQSNGDTHGYYAESAGVIVRGECVPMCYQE